MVGINFVPNKEKIKLVSILRTAGSDKIDTQDFLIKTCLKQSSSNTRPVPTGYAGVDADPRNTNKMYIAGYNTTFYPKDFGIADTRLVPNAEYSLHLFATKQNMYIGFLVNLFQTKNSDSWICKGAKDLGSLCGFIHDNADYDSFNFGGKAINQELFSGPVITFSYGTFGTPVPMYASCVITNVSKKRFSYFGDVTLRLDHDLRAGAAYLLGDDKNLLKSESLRTKDVLFGHSIVGDNLRLDVSQKIKYISKFVDASGFEHDSKNWLLLVKGV